MQLQSLFLFALPLADAAIADLYSDKECKHKVGKRNVWDNSCAATVIEFMSMNITIPSNKKQFLSVWNGNHCIGRRAQRCLQAKLFAYPLGEGSNMGCIPTFNARGGAKAISSCGFCL
ncbi:hypothetical protein B0T14DRAFT_498652 [Immersiella caudata]|uniref:Uncharacterized protein n=1 Tax=Immersiella caudata TaxID=314043 RepID=A0AA39WLM5_9PEZI|nr:hypothetical protein B0T14DRAFT_498652 [Immersiella caudata]